MFNCIQFQIIETKTKRCRNLVVQLKIFFVLFEKRLKVSLFFAPLTKILNSLLVYIPKIIKSFADNDRLKLQSVNTGWSI